MEFSPANLAVGSASATLIWSVSFWYLLRYERKFIDHVDRKGWYVTAAVTLFAPLLLAGLGIKRWHIWSLD